MNRRTASLLTALFFLLGDRCWGQEPKPLLWAADADGGVPYVFKDADGSYIGFEVDLKDALAKELGRPIHFKQYDFDSLLNGLDERQDFDLAMNGLEITSENRRKALFTRPYYLYQLQLVVRRGEKDFRTLEQARAKGKTIGTLSGSAAYRLLHSMEVEKRGYNDQDGPYKDLSRGQIDGVLLDLPAAIYYASPDPHLKHTRRKPGLEFAGPAFAQGFYGIAVHKENHALAAQLNQALENLFRSGEMKRILTKWELWNADQYRVFALDEATQVESEMGWEIYLPLLLQGAGLTVFITFAGMTLAILLALPISLSRLYGPWPLRMLATLYVEFFRGIPVLILLYFLYYGLADLSPDYLSMGPLQAAILGFGLNYAAYEAEIYRAGIGSIPRGQWEAAASLGMSGPLTFRRIILPQAFRVILPPMTNDLVALFKDTSVVSIIAVTELSKQYQILSKSGAGFVKIGLVTAALYLIMSVPLGYLSRYLEKLWGAER